jgi:hypothetical protein
VRPAPIKARSPAHRVPPSDRPPVGRGPLMATRAVEFSRDPQARRVHHDSQRENHCLQAWGGMPRLRRDVDKSKHPNGRFDPKETSPVFFYCFCVKVGYLTGLRSIRQTASTIEWITGIRFDHVLHQGRLRICVQRSLGIELIASIGTDLGSPRFPRLRHWYRASSSSERGLMWICSHAPIGTDARAQDSAPGEPGRRPRGTKHY